MLLPVFLELLPSEFMTTKCWMLPRVTWKLPGKGPLGKPGAFESAFMPLGFMLQCRELPSPKLLPSRCSWRKTSQQPDLMTDQFILGTACSLLWAYGSCHVPTHVVQGRTSKILVWFEMELFDSETIYSCGQKGPCPSFSLDTQDV